MKNARLAIGENLIRIVAETILSKPPGRKGLNSDGYVYAHWYDDNGKHDFTAIVDDDGDVFIATDGWRDESGY